MKGRLHEPVCPNSKCGGGIPSSALRTRISFVNSSMGSMAHSHVHPLVHARDAIRDRLALRRKAHVDVENGGELYRCLNNRFASGCLDRDDGRRGRRGRTNGASVAD